jgi:hypothetical protein
VALLALLLESGFLRGSDSAEAVVDTVPLFVAALGRRCVDVTQMATLTSP